MSSYCKYYKEKKQVSYDNGITWSDVVPAEYRQGNLIQAGSADCQIGPSGYTNQYFTLVPLENGNLTVGLVDTNRSYVIYYSIDTGTTWNTLNLTSTSTVSIQATSGKKVMFKGNGYNTYLRFDSSCNYYTEGNILSLDYGDSFTGQTSAPNTETGGWHRGLFEYSTKLLSAENLILPHYFSTYSGALGTCAYLFRGCTSLATAPELPATTLINGCYAGMFEGCTSLTTAPSLPATALTEHCYYYMFEGCTSLTTTPSLPATTLAFGCYDSMFKGCTNLTSIPTLSATTLANYCYSGMFQGCTSLTTVPSNYLPATTLADYCYNFMFGDCTSLTSAPSLPATTLSDSCYRVMFTRCTSLTTAPDLPATTLVTQCYYYMFQGCTSLNYVKCLATNISATDCTHSWLNNVASSGTFVKNSSMSSWPSGISGIPSNWSVQDA